MPRAASFLKWIAGAVTILAVLYVAWRLYENHEGAMEWQRSIADQKQRGEPSEATELIPPIVPAADNLGALPLLQYSHSRRPEIETPAALEAAQDNIVGSAGDFPRLDWTGGKLADQAAIKSYLSSRWHKAFPGKKPPATLVEECEALCPALVELRAESAKRSVCRLEQDYTSQPVFNRPLSLTTEMIRLAKVVNLHAVLALEAGQTDFALQDIDLMLKIDAGLRRQPNLISGLVAIGVLAIELDAIWEGLENHAWNDAQLASLQRDLSRIDFLPDYQLCMRGEGLGFFAPTMHYMRDNQETAARVMFYAGGLIGDDPEARPNKILLIFWKLTPPGCLDQSAARGVTFYTRAAREGVDISRHRVFPKSCQSLKEEIDRLSYFSLPNILLRVSAKSVIGSASAFGAGQFHADAARIACMIERYRYAHGALPAKLDELAPFAGDGAGLPHDLCNGEALHYAPRPDGTYLLYSVGWNLLDGQGQVAHRADYQHSVDRENGDWVWPQLGHPGI